MNPLKAFYGQYKLAIHIGIGIAIVILLVWAGMAVKKWLQSKGFTQAALPDAASVGVNLTPQEAQLVRAIAQKLNTDIEKWNNPLTAKRDTETWTQLLETTDPLFIAVYNDYGNLYFSTSGKTLKQALQGENFTLTSSVFTPYGIITGGQLKDALLERFDSLNLQ